jgi:hypothetical protein
LHVFEAGDPHFVQSFFILGFDEDEAGSPAVELPPARDAEAASPESRAVVFLGMSGEQMRDVPRARRVFAPCVWHLITRSVSHDTNRRIREFRVI